ncbi:hypothetical protein B0J14DRAFT_156972 [Halenospora varia]|nr:hypothetical protein B0J14DRAFT_156972 [Halenospora varia]
MHLPFFFPIPSAITLALALIAIPTYAEFSRPPNEVGYCCGSSPGSFTGCTSFPSSPLPTCPFSQILPSPLLKSRLSQSNQNKT